MKPVLICLGIFVGMTAMLFGDFGWIFLVCASVLWGIFQTPRFAVQCLIVLTGVAILTAHFTGFKVYGGATVRDNRPLLHSPRQIAALAYPNVVLTTDGGRLKVRGVVFGQRLLEVAAADLQMVFPRRKGLVPVEADPASPSGIVFERRMEYWCGNTFFPTFFPRHLPAYSREDMGKYLVDRKLATAEDWL